MSTEYSELENGFYFVSSNNQARQELQRLLKHEVGLVQGKRRKSRKVEVGWEKVGGGDGESSSRVFQLKGSVSKKKSNLDFESSEKSPIQQDLKKLFNRFCFQLGIHRLPDDSGDYGRQHAGGKRKRKTQASGNNEESGVNDSGNSEDKTNKNDGGKRQRKKLKTGGDGDSDGDEDKRPHKISSSSTPESASSNETPSETDNPTTTTSAGSKILALTSPGRSPRKSKKKRKVVTSESSETSSVDEQKPEEKVPKIAHHISHPNGIRSTVVKSKKIKKKSKMEGEEYPVEKGVSNESIAQTEPEEKVPKIDHQISHSNGIRSTVVSFKSKKSKKESKMEGEEYPVGKAVSFSNFIAQLEPEEKHRKSSGRKPKKSTRSLSHTVRPVSSLHDIVDLQSMEQEKGDEWLEWSSSEDETQDEDAADMEKAKKNSSKEIPIQHDLQLFMESTKVLDKINSIMGLNPYTKVVRSNQCVQVKWVPKSVEYIGVCINAFLFFAITLSMFFSLLTILGYDIPQSTTHKIIKLDFAHHFLEGAFLMLLTLFLAIWGVSCILELGVHYALFYTRLNMGIVLTKFDVSEGLHEMIVKHMASVLLFEIALVMLFFEGYVHTSIVRESCGFLGFTILRPFNFGSRESIYYPLVEIFGLLVFLYSFLAMNVILLHFIVHSKALGNMAKHFNLRLAYAFGSLTEIYVDGESKHVKKVIPFKKLWAEHQIVTSLFRHVSQVNTVVFGAFIFTMVGEIVLVMWLFFDIFLEEHPPGLQGVSLERTGGVVLAVPLRLQKNEGERLIKAFVIFSVTWLMFWIFGGVMHNAGDAVHIGMEYVRRFGLTRCKNSKEIRFILSMMNSFTPKSPYWIGRKFKFSRTFFVALTSFIVGASMVVTSFRPERLSLTSIELCDENGVCRVVTVYKTAQHIVYSTLNVDPPSGPINPPPVGVLPPPGPPGVGHVFRYNSFLQTPPCTSQGAYPVIESTVSGNIYTEWSSPISQLKLPFLYEQRSVADPASSATAYNLFHPQSTADPLKYPMKNCYGEDITNPPETDDCQNPSFACPKRGDWFVKIAAPTEKQLIAVNQIPGYPDASDERFFCCYKYATSSDNEVRACNLPSKVALDSKCSLTALSSTKLLPFIKKLRAMRNTGGNRDDLASGVPFSDPIRTRWTNCLCKQDINECDKLTGPVPTPPPPLPPGPTPPPDNFHRCLNSPAGTPDDKRFFTKCRVQDMTGKHKDLPFILVPTIFQIEKGAFVQKLKLKSECDPDYDNYRPPSGTSDKFGDTKPWYDCSSEPFTQVDSPRTFYPDDCKNFIPSKPATRWNPRLKIRVVVLVSDAVACCVDYQVPDPRHSRLQTLVCHNMKDITFQCNLNKNSRGGLLELYIRVWNQLQNNEAKQMELESSNEAVKCMCQHLIYVEHAYGFLPPAHDCRNHFNSFLG